MSSPSQIGNFSGDPEEKVGWQIRFLLVWIGLLWLVEFVDFLSGNHLIMDQFGIQPRTLVGLIGIPLAPFLHAGFSHLAANTLPLAALSWLTLNTGTLRFWIATACSILVGGLGVWLLGGSNTVHVGASGLIFGYLGFLLAYGIFQRSLIWIFISIGVGAAYGGMIWSVLPGQDGISWQGHLFGFGGGVLAAWLLRARVSKSEQPEPASP